MTNPRGRPTDYTPELALEICRMIAENKSLRAICREEGMPSFQTFYTWIDKYPNFLEQYRKAREIQTEIRAEEVYALPFECETAGLDAAYTKLKMDGAKWAASKGNPKKYGDKAEIEHSGTLNVISEVLNSLPKSEDVKS